MTTLLTVYVHTKSQSQPIKYERVANTYTKDGLFCVYTADDVVFKHPVEDIFRVKEQYGAHLTES